MYAAQKCSVCHAIAGKGSKTSPLDGVGTKLSADDIRAWIVDPTEMAAKTKSTKKPPMPNEVRQAAGGRPRRARRLHAEPEVAERHVPSRAALARHPLAIVGRGDHHGRAPWCSSRWRSPSCVGLLNNPYAGLVVFVVVPALFVLGLLLIPSGMWLQQRKLRAGPERGRATGPCWTSARHGCAARRCSIVALTAVNLIILLLAGYGTLHWMESPSFCGQVCHAPMHPQFTAWQAAPHSRVRLHRLPHRRGRPGVPALQVRRRPAAVSRGDEPDSEADPGCGRHAAGTRDLRQLPLARTGIRRSPPRHPRIRRRRNQHRDDDAAADVRRRARTADAARDARFTGTRTRGSTSSTSRPTRNGRRFPTSR